MTEKDETKQKKVDEQTPAKSNSAESKTVRGSLKDYTKSFMGNR